MPNIPISSPLSYVGVTLFIFGFFLVISGMGIIKIEKITVTQGAKTWLIGIFLAVMGVLFLVPELKAPGVVSEEAPTIAPTMQPANEEAPTVTSGKQPAGESGAASDVYDDFENSNYEGEFDRSNWEYEGEDSELALQQDGVLVLQKERGSQAPRMHIREGVDFVLTAPSFFEFDMMLSEEEHSTGTISLHIQFDPLSGGYWISECGLSVYGPVAYCGEDASWSNDEMLYDLKKPADWGEWHTFRIEIDPTTMTFSYFIDGEPFGTDVPEDAEKLKQARVSAHIEVYGEINQPVTGYFDNIRFGPMDE